MLQDLLHSDAPVWIPCNVNHVQLLPHVRWRMKAHIKAPMLDPPLQPVQYNDHREEQVMQIKTVDFAGAGPGSVGVQSGRAETSTATGQQPAA